MDCGTKNVKLFYFPQMYIRMYCNITHNAQSHCFKNITAQFKVVCLIIAPFESLCTQKREKHLFAMRKNEITEPKNVSLRYLTACVNSVSMAV